MNREPHPRPQFVRERWTDLSGEWQFGYDDDDRGVAGRWYEPGSHAPFDRTIVVPYPPESKLSGVGDPSVHPVVWYRRDFARPVLRDDERLLLHFGAVDYHASVWVNGHHLGDHTGGHTPFSFDLAGLVREGANVVVVRAEDRAGDVAQPRGKQDWLPEPHAIWYHRTTGIWQPVWLEPVAALHIAELAWTPDLPAASLGLDVRLNIRPRRPVRLRVRLTRAGQVVADQGVRIGTDIGHCDLGIPLLRHGPNFAGVLWSPESPTLLDAEVWLDDAGATVDTVSSYVGLRSVGFRDGRFLLNGKPYYQRLALAQGYWPESHLAAPDAGALRREVELAKELGFNGVRVHQKVEDPRFLYWCDRLGLLVWAEMPSAYEFSSLAMRRLVGEWMEVIRRDRSHPCIVTWVPLNESWGVPAIADAADQQHYASALYHLTRCFDPTRPVISNDGWEHTESDLWSVHDYAPTGQSLRERYGDRDAVNRTLFGAGPGRRRILLGRPQAGAIDPDPRSQAGAKAPDPRAEWRGQPVILSEFGGLSFAPAAGEAWFGYSTVGSRDELLERLHELFGAVLDCDEIAGFCYTQLTDTLQERNGLLTEDRAPKLPAGAIRELVTRPSRAIPAEAVDAYRRAARGTP